MLKYLSIALLVTSSALSHATEPPPTPTNVLSIFTRKARAASDPDQILLEVYRAAGEDQIPPYVFEYSRTLPPDPDPDGEQGQLRRYVRAFEFARQPKADGSRRTAAESHAFAVAVLERRQSGDALTFELDQIERARRFLSSIPNFEVGEIEATATKMAAVIDRGFHYRFAERDDLWREWFRTVFPTVHQYFAERRGPLSATRASVGLIRSLDTGPLLLDRELWDMMGPNYAKALHFAMSPPPAGPGFDPAAAHAYASDHRRSSHAAWTNWEEEAFTAAYDKLIRAPSDEGLGLPAAAARQRAWSLASERSVVPDADEVLDVLEAERVIPIFVKTPIVEGGLGLPSPLADLEVRRWLSRDPRHSRLKSEIDDYQRFLPRILARQVRMGTRDDALARDQTLALIGSEKSFVEALDYLSDGKYPYVTLAELPGWIEDHNRAVAPAAEPKRRGRLGRVGACLRDLLAGT